jgi:hypothetical protein
MPGTRARATQPVLRSFRSHLVDSQHVGRGLECRPGGDIPLNAMYTLVDISNSFTTSDGLNPNDIADSLSRAQAQLRRAYDSCNVPLARAGRSAIFREHKALSGSGRECKNHRVRPPFEGLGPRRAILIAYRCNTRGLAY